MAKYPSPDDVVPVSDVAGTHLDGVFIGACTTAEEDLVMGALVLQAGLDAGRKPVARGERRVVPGSRPIADYLRKTGLADIYERAGFIIGIPGCSYCVGMGADMAKPGEVWLSSQNRNFENRMGKGKSRGIYSRSFLFPCLSLLGQNCPQVCPISRWIREQLCDIAQETPLKTLSRPKLS